MTKGERKKGKKRVFFYFSKYGTHLCKTTGKCRVFTYSLLPIQTLEMDAMPSMEHGLSTGSHTRVAFPI